MTPLNFISWLQFISGDQTQGTLGCSLFWALHPKVYQLNKLFSNG
jgi:hypothetical protein